MLKRITLCAGAVLALFGTAACNDDAFLTEVPYDFVGPENFYQTSGDALAAIAGVYATSTHTTGDGYYGRNFIMLSEFMTEMQTVYLSATNARSLVDNYTFTASHAYIYTTWQVAYQGINRANSVIGRVPAIEMDATLRGRIVAEAKFLRALHYLNLVRLFGGVPLRVTETTSIDSLQQPRNTADEVWAQIFTDLTDAAAALPSLVHSSGPCTPSWATKNSRWPTTVSRALSGYRDVSPTTRERGPQWPLAFGDRAGEGHGNSILMRPPLRRCRPQPRQDQRASAARDQPTIPAGAGS